MSSTSPKSPFVGLFPLLIPPFAAYGVAVSHMSPLRSSLSCLYPLTHSHFPERNLFKWIFVFRRTDCSQLRFSRGHIMSLRKFAPNSRFVINHGRYHAKIIVLYSLVPGSGTFFKSFAFSPLELFPPAFGSRFPILRSLRPCQLVPTFSLPCTQSIAASFRFFFSFAICGLTVSICLERSFFLAPRSTCSVVFTVSPPVVFPPVPNV